MRYIRAAIVFVPLLAWLCCMPAAAVGPKEPTQTPQLVANLADYNILVEYYQPRDQEQFGSLYAKLRQRKVLEELGQFLAAVKWPTTLRLIMKQCPDGGTPQPEVFYNEIEYSLIICYQVFTRSLEQAAQGNPSIATPQEVIVGGLVGAVLHESARAMFDMLDVPRFGSEEDAADQLAGFIGLQFGDNVARAVIKGTYALWKYYDAQIRLNNQAYNLSAASVAPQRADNILCMAYGAQAATFKDLVNKVLPPTRASHCADEYRQVSKAFGATFQAPRVNMDMMNKAHSVTWILPEDLK